MKLPEHTQSRYNQKKLRQSGVSTSEEEAKGLQEGDQGDHKMETIHIQEMREAGARTGEVISPEVKGHPVEVRPVSGSQVVNSVVMRLTIEKIVPLVRQSADTAKSRDTSRESVGR